MTGDPRRADPAVESRSLRRHGLFAQVAHGADALAVLILLVTGFAVGGVLPEAVASGLGGHVALNGVHRELGLALSLLLVLATVLLFRRMARLVAAALYFPPRDWRWPWNFALHLVRPSRHAVPFHAGRFDPAQRLVFLALIASLCALCASGLYLYWSPPLPPSLMGPMIRVHVVAAWVLIAALGLHLLAAIGVLPTHRHLLGAMFGSGCVPVEAARRLWPGWTARRLAGTPDPRRVSAGAQGSAPK